MTRHALYAMDTLFYHSLGSYDFDARCEMLRDLGYDATYLTIWDEPAWHETTWQDVSRLAEVQARYGLDVAAVYVTLDIGAPDNHPGNHRIVHLLETMEGCATVEVSIVAGGLPLRPSDPSGDAPATRWLGLLLRAAERHGVTLALYPHATLWLERIEDAVRICRAFDHPLLRAVFCGYHWYAVDGTQLPVRLREAAPYLRLVNICGSRRTGYGPPTIEPLDEGELDNVVLLSQLRHVGYDGPVGVQGYGIGGDAYAKLRRSIAAFRDMERRLDQHPSWADLRFG